MRPFIFVSLATTVWATGAARPQVTVASGIILGTTTTLSSATAAVNQYLGIPYAMSPPERFSPPASPAKWSEPLDASSWKAACFQQFNFPPTSQQFNMEFANNPVGPAPDPAGPPPEESEDCLYLNIYTPTSPAPKTGRPVMFWIHGGNLQFGTGGIHWFDGSSFAANQDVVIVTINYRTNVFGFPNSPQVNEVGKQNLGFLDQRLALDWVHNNIAAFGGDQNQITVFGESAGGWSVKQIFATPPSPLNFRAVIMESEASQYAGNSSANWDTLAAMVGCTNATSVIDCVRTQPAANIKSIIETHTLDFAPIYDNITAVEDISGAIQSHTAAQVPFIIGTNADEGRIIAVPAGITMETPIAAANAYLNATFPNNTPLQQAIVAAYPEWISSSAYYLVSAIITDSLFHCPAMEIGNLATTSGYDVWRYYFNATFPNTQYFPNAGAYHTAEIFEVYGTYPTQNATKQQIDLSKYMQNAWASFAKDPKSGPGWPRLRKEGTHDLAGLGVNGIHGEKTIDRTPIDKICEVYKTVVTAL